MVKITTFYKSIAYFSVVHEQIVDQKEVLQNCVEVHNHFEAESENADVGRQLIISKTHWFINIYFSILFYFVKISIGWKIPPWLLTTSLYPRMWTVAAKCIGMIRRCKAEQYVYPLKLYFLVRTLGLYWFYWLNYYLNV